MIEAARALAALHGRPYVLAQDISAVAADVLRHRITPSDEALVTQTRLEDLVNALIAAIPEPAMPLD